MEENRDRHIRDKSPELYVFNFLKRVGIYIPVLTVLSYLVSLIKTYSFYYWYSFDIAPFLSLTDILLPNASDVLIVAGLITFILIFSKWLVNSGKSKIKSSKFYRLIVIVNIILFLCILVYGFWQLWESRNDPLRFRYNLGEFILLSSFAIIFVLISIIIKKFERPGDVNLFSLLCFHMLILFAPSIIGWGKAYETEFKVSKNRSIYKFSDKTIITSDSVFCIGVSSNYIFMFHKSDRSTSIYKISDVSSLQLRNP